VRALAQYRKVEERRLAEARSVFTDKSNEAGLNFR
jgi:hypothetical protein